MRKDGSTFWAHVVIDAIRDDSGNLLGFAKTTRDITDKKKTELSLAQAREELFQSQKMESIGQLTGGVAHDFNNLLSIISSGVQIFSRQAPTPSQLAVIDTIQRAVDRGSALTQQLLAFARQQPLAPAHHSINKIIENFETVLRRAVPASINFSTTLGGDAGWVNVDEARLEATILNLVVNARDAMPDGGTLALSTTRMQVEADAPGATEAGQYVCITVADSGTGIARELLDRVFDPFFTTKPVGKGTGLGLSQVQGLIVQSGGRVNIDSTPGIGTRVHLILPLVAVPAEHLQVEDEATELVIIVEDEVELAGLAKSLFETLGYQALVAYTGQDALCLLAQNPHADLLFSDVMMPGMTGIELAHSARALYPSMKIILASGYAALTLRTKGDIDAFDFVAKPYRLSEIVKKLR